MRFLRQSTASQEILLGPFCDDTDGKTPETGLTIANTDIKLLVGGATSEASKNSGGGTHIAGGRYSAVLDATDTATVGILEVSVNATGALPFTKSYYVLEEAVFDAMYAASAPGYLQPTTAGRTLDVSSTGNAGIDFDNIQLTNAAPIVGIVASGTLSGTHSTTTADLGANAPSLDMTGKWLRIPTRDVSSYISAYNTSTGVATFSPATAATLANSDQWYVTDSPYLPTDTSLMPTSKISVGTGTGQINLSSGKVPATIAAGDLAANSLTASALAADFVAEMADGVWDEATAGHSTAGTTGKALTDASSAGDPWSTALPGSYGAGTAGKIIGDNITGNAYTRLGAPAGASVSADVAAVKSQTAAIETDTQDLQSRTPAALVSGRMDSSVGAMAANVMTAAAAAADLTTELQSGLATASSIAALNNLSSAQAQTAATAALNSYDPPTRAEATTDANSILTALADVPTNAELATALDGIPTAEENATELLDSVVDGSTTFAESVRLVNAVLAGKASGLDTTSVTFRDLGDTTDRVVATVDTSGNRTALTLDLS